MTAALIAFAHHVLFLAVIVALAVELVSVRTDLSARELRRVQIVDAVYGVTGMLLIVVGVLRVLYFEKGTDYYLHNVFFVTKMGLLIVVGALSVYPTVRFIVWGNRLAAGTSTTLPAVEVKTARLLIHAELTGIALAMLCAALMAKGIG